ncbi:MAG: SulP family inorganic anion transporter [Lachnospiraceae bacterium]
MLKPKLFSIIKHRGTELSKEQISNDIISGIIVAIIALPLSVALAIASGVTPEKGLITAIIAGFLISFLGGSRVQIGGPTGAFVIIVSGIIAQFGLQGLTIATIMAGLFMIFFGLMKLGGIIKFIPYPTTTGFTSGIAIVLFSTQINDFLGLSIENVPADFVGKWHAYFTNISSIHILTVCVGLVSLLLIILWPKINKTIPGSLVALVVVTLGVKIFHIPVETIGSQFGEISNSFHLIDFSSYHITSPMLKELIPPAVTIAFLASIESLLSAVVSDDMIGKKHNSNVELVALGIANIASAIFGGIPATGAIARTAANVKNGGRTPIAGITHAVTLFLIMIFFMPLAKLIPMSTLAAILMVVSYNMSEWRSFKDLLKSTKSDVAVLIITFLLTIFFDLVVAIEIGMIVAMFLFVRRMSETTMISNISNEYANMLTDDLAHNNQLQKETNTLHLDSQIMLYEINGPLFFGASSSFADVMNKVDIQTNIIILKMTHVSTMDATALNALKQIDQRCRNHHILLLYSELNHQPAKLLNKTGFTTLIGEDRFFDTTEDAINVANEIIHIHITSSTSKRNMS